MLTTVLPVESTSFPVTLGVPSSRTKAPEESDDRPGIDKVKPEPEEVTVPVYDFRVEFGDFSFGCAMNS